MKAVVKNIEYYKSPNYNDRVDEQSPDLLVLHYTGMSSISGTIERLCDPVFEVSCHYLIAGNGKIIQMVDEKYRAWHAGVSSWQGRDDINSCSIGIEIANVGHENGYPDFPDVQMSAVEELCLDIFKRHEIPAERVLAHSDIAPGRKIDPGEKFDWQRLHRAGIGMWVEPEPLDGEEYLQEGGDITHVMNLQNALSLYGYQVEATGSLDAQTKIVLEAFQRHFRPERVDGNADFSTLKTLYDLLGVLEKSRFA